MRMRERERWRGRVRYRCTVGTLLALRVYGSAPVVMQLRVKKCGANGGSQIKEHLLFPSEDTSAEGEEEGYNTGMPGA